MANSVMEHVEYPFGRGELYGIAYRTDFDLKAHALNYRDEGTKDIFAPHVIEPTFGVDRTFLALFCEAYDEDELLTGGQDGDKRVVLRLKPNVAPIKAAVFPLLANKQELVRKAKEIYEMLKPEMATAWDDIGNIGKRYRRQDEIGTPFCVTIDFDTLENNTVTVRDRDTGKQDRIKIEELTSYLKDAIK